MAKFIFAAGLLLAIAAVVTTLPAAEYEPLEMMEEAENFEAQEFENPEEDHLRFRRVTCDLLSFKGVVGDSACAANCLSMGKAGGRCNNGVCQCRRTKIADLWHKRFG